VLWRRRARSKTLPEYSCDPHAMEGHSQSCAAAGTPTQLAACDDTEFFTLGDRDRGVTVLQVERDFHRK